MLNTQLVKENFAENATLFNFSYTMTIDVLRSWCVHGNLLQQFVFYPSSTIDRASTVSGKIRFRCEVMKVWMQQSVVSERRAGVIIG